VQLCLLVLGTVLQAANGPLPGMTDEYWTLVPLTVGFPAVGLMSTASGAVSP
jgi:hypothetical protein